MLYNFVRNEMYIDVMEWKTDNNIGENVDEEQFFESTEPLNELPIWRNNLAQKIGI